MTVIDLVTDIDAPIERVFDVARDLDLHARSMAHTGERAVAGKTTGFAEAGDTVTWRARHFGIWWSLTSRITKVEAPVRFEDVQERGPFAWFRHEHRFERVGDATRMRDHWEHRSPLGPLGRLVDFLVLGRYMRSLLVTRNDALKSEAEGYAVLPEDQRLLVLYDADCGICMRTARFLGRLDRRQALHLMAAQAADDIPGAPPLEVRLKALHVRDQAGHWTTAGTAGVRIAEALPALRPLALLSRIPGALGVIEAVYAIVAANRNRLSRALGDNACPLDSVR